MSDQLWLFSMISSQIWMREFDGLDLYFESLLLNNSVEGIEQWVPSLKLLSPFPKLVFTQDICHKTTNIDSLQRN